MACTSASYADPQDSIVIENSGSTNTLGYRIIVSADGQASFESGNSHGRERLPADLLSRLKYDVMMAQPLSHVRSAATCMKPASFGTSIFVSLGAERTADLTCPASPKGEALKSDAEEIAGFLKLASVPRRPGGGVLPGMP